MRSLTVCLKYAKEYDATLSLGDGLRPGCLADATDRPQIQELIHTWRIGISCQKIRCSSYD